MELGVVGKGLLVVGGLLVCLGGLLVLAEKFGLEGGVLSWFGNLPGDLSIKRNQFGLYLPLASSLVVSVVVSLILFLVSSFFRR